MPDYWEPSGQWMQRFRKALNEAFNAQSMELLTTDYFGPSLAFSNLAPASPGSTHEFRLYELINQARMDDWLLDLVAAAHERRPKNAVLAGVAEELGLTATGPRVDNPTGQSLEALIQEHAKYIDPTVFHERLPALFGQICWVDIPGGGGTGFLIGPDRVLTNQHVIDPVKKGRARVQDVKCVFDYREPIDGSKLETKKPTKVGLAQNWLAFDRPPSEYDWQPTLGTAGPEEIDCAVITLDAPVGDLPLGGLSTDPAAEPRNWIAANAEAAPLATGNQVFLLQHPKGEPLRLTIGTVTEFNAAGNRVRYNANSKDGSSGSPCFDADLRLVAMHHAHDPAYPPAWNQAIPLDSIQEVWRKHDIVLD